MAGDGKEPILDFMVVRAPDRLPDREVRRRYIHDRVLVVPDTTAGPAAPDAQDLEVVSGIGAIVYKLVMQDRLPPEKSSYDRLRDELLTLVPASRVRPAAGTATGPVLRLDDLAAHAHLRVGDAYHVLPDRLDRLDATQLPLLAGLLRARPVLEDTARLATPASFDLAALSRELDTAFGAELPDVVLSATGHTEDFRKLHRALFESLYLLYLMRRFTTVDLSDVIGGLRALHAIDALARDRVYTAVRAGNPAAGPAAVADALVATAPEFAGWSKDTDLPGLPNVTSAADLAELLDARPVLNPLLAQLFWFTEPFNAITPIGIGDLKVVKQWLTAYLPGEISHIHNIMRGENRGRIHRLTEKSEEVFSLTSGRTEEKSRDTSSTERFEVKAETEKVVRSQLNVTANANLTYNNSAAMITASAGAGFGYTRSSEDHGRTTQNFARDVVTKAVERVQTQTTSQRTTTQTFETDETNRQTFDNTKGEEHISGIYRWVDKEYTAQVYNYGKRLMFEFVVPEPAAFWVEARLRGYENTLDVPQPPFPEPVRAEASLPFTWEQVDEKLFASLKLKYDLREVPPYPPPTRLVAGRDPQTRGRRFEEKDITDEDHTRTFDCTIVGGAGYRVASVRLDGYGEFHEQTEDNAVRLLLDGRAVWEEQRFAYKWTFDWHVGPIEEIVLLSDDTSLGFVFNNKMKFYGVELRVELERLPTTLENWQRLVFDTVTGVEQKKLDDAHDREQLAFEAATAEYRNRLDQLKAVTIGEILAGRSDAANREIIDEEIKKHCLTLMTKEFDSVGTDDELARAETTRPREVVTSSYRLKVAEATKADEATTVAYRLTDETGVRYPAVVLDEARKKGVTVQFLEQAFEWERLSYVFYPYFWAHEKSWIELMNREDDADATFTAFLRSGMARVLVAATPAYEDAVLHYLDTREPWAGGPSPVIGDPLFVSLADELRSQTDDRTGGTAEGEPWTFVVPTSLVYLHGSEDALPDISAERGGQTRREVPGHWTGTWQATAHSVLPTGQTEWTTWPADARWEVTVPTWAAAADIGFVLNPGVAGGDVWGQLRIDFGGVATTPSMFDVNYETDFGNFPEQNMMMAGGTVALPAAMRGKPATVTIQGRMRDPQNCPGHLEVYPGVQIHGQVTFRPATDVVVPPV